MGCRYYGHHLTAALAYTGAMPLRIKELRDAQDLTQAQLAAAAGMSRSQLAMIEVGKRPANTIRLRAIAKALGVEPDELFSRESDRQSFFAVFRSLSPDDQDIVERLAESLAAKTGKAG